MERVKAWLKRLGCFFVVILWLVGMLFPSFAFVLAAEGQIELGNQTGWYARFFLVREDDGEGIGVETTRPFRGQDQCVKNNITYFMWEGNASEQNNSYCQCFDPSTGNPLPVLENSCE